MKKITSKLSALKKRTLGTRKYTAPKNPQATSSLKKKALRKPTIMTTKGEGDG